MPSKPEVWGARLTRVIAERVKAERKRKELKWSAQDLSDAIAKLGFDFPRSTLADLESGRRNHISVAELLVIAAALNVPPVLLIAPPGAEAEITPGNRVDAFRAVQWISGETPIPHAGDEAYIRSITDDWHAATKNPLPLLRAHARAVSEETWELDRAKSLEASALAAAGEGERNALAEAALARRAVAEARHVEAEKYRAQAVAMGLLPSGGDW